MKKIAPVLDTKLLLISSLAGWFFDIGLFGPDVKLFMQRIEKDYQELLCILLLIAHKLFMIFAHDCFELSWPHRAGEP